VLKRQDRTVVDQRIGAAQPIVVEACARDESVANRAWLQPGSGCCRWWSAWQFSREPRPGEALVEHRLGAAFTGERSWATRCGFCCAAMNRGAHRAWAATPCWVWIHLGTEARLGGARSGEPGGSERAESRLRSRLAAQLCPGGM